MSMENLTETEQILLYGILVGITVVFFFCEFFSLLYISEGKNGIN